MPVLTHMCWFSKGLPGGLNFFEINQISAVNPKTLPQLHNYELCNGDSVCLYRSGAFV
jgi:hypothetical protein